MASSLNYINLLNYVIGKDVRIVDRKRNHTGKNLNLIGRKGRVVGSSKNYVYVELYSISNPNNLLEKAYFYPEELVYI